MKIIFKIKPITIYKIYKSFTFFEFKIIKTNNELRFNLIILNLFLSLIRKSF
jgi:hypothetical protein